MNITLCMYQVHVHAEKTFLAEQNETLCHATLSLQMFCNKMQENRRITITEVVLTFPKSKKC